jgi:hypothetical protein
MGLTKARSGATISSPVAWYPLSPPLAIAFFDEKIRLENLARNWKEEGRHLVLLFRPTSHATVKPWPNQSSTQSRQAQIVHFFDHIATTI